MLDTQNKKYKEYLWILGFKNGTTLPFQDIEDLYINQVDREGQFGFVARVNTRKTVYMGFVKLIDDGSIFIGEHRNEDKLLKKVKKVADFAKMAIRKNY